MYLDPVKLDDNTIGILIYFFDKPPYKMVMGFQIDHILWLLLIHYSF